MPSAVVAISGASGARYGVRLIESLRDANWDVNLIISREGAINLDLECGITPQELASQQGVILEDNDNLAAKSASGSAKFDGYIICPASGTTVGKLASGISDNLITRSGMVALKEKRKLILVPRETPYATIQLENMAKLSGYGVVILPANPGYYNKPESIDDLVDFVVARILDQLDVEHNLSQRWSGGEVKLAELADTDFEP
ncbi:MAG TPA: UbiX family flavin prenyltransferase [Candidatus Thalassarchaeaceae archaeon]|jgi:4-hydroxy-3-polyprenylbenzoate decarboxylase|nr:UbiX family flavin prenyltransferase [Candidatus Thalassarchaeaceae archaeon]HJM18992.1 UbiX family flavin prenyltransferase [Candidatus Thalassarchaeaceae archaeon]